MGAAHNLSENTTMANKSYKCTIFNSSLLFDVNITLPAGNNRLVRLCIAPIGKGGDMSKCAG